MDEWTWYHMFKRRFCKKIPAAWEAFYHSWLLSCSQPIRWWWCQVNSLVSASKWRGCHLYELWLMAKFLSFESTRLRSRNERESSTEEREQNFKDWAKKLNVFHSKKVFSLFSLWANFDFFLRFRFPLSLNSFLSKLFEQLSRGQRWGAVSNVAGQSEADFRERRPPIGWTHLTALRCGI